jgi:hypothetical protein
MIHCERPGPATGSFHVVLSRVQLASVNPTNFQFVVTEPLDHCGRRRKSNELAGQRGVPSGQPRWGARPPLS